jgi:hypothetical protein
LDCPLIRRGGKWDQQQKGSKTGDDKGTLENIPGYLVGGKAVVEADKGQEMQNCIKKCE